MQTVSRLIHTFIPDHYNLSLNLQREKRTFSGLVSLHGLSTPGSTTISVHAKDLTIESATLDGKAASFTKAENDELIISHPDITEGKHIIAISFSGTITDAMHGLYPCYFEHNGVKKELLATQFESHHAREVFPCIDEPEAKASFDLTLTTEQNITVLGNMPVKIQRTENDQLLTIFETTPRMSTYLLAWVTGELHKKTATTKSGVEVNIWATTAQKPESLDFALDIATRSIEFFNDYFGTPYPLPKSDHVALPDFSSGAMENWGLITYREMALLADPAIAGISSKQYVANVITHELSHQWFGNLVTMKWWNNLWLNESFASLMQYIALDGLHPEWNVWLDFSSNENIPALRRDSIDGVQAVQVEVNHPDEIGTLFDGAIVYAKGARLLRMLQHYIGDEAFQTGLKDYFTKHAYSNTEGDDLWQALSKSSGKNIARLMNTWISQPGYPVVSVQESGHGTTISQKQFFIGPHKDIQRLWPIPLDASSTEAPTLLEVSEYTFPSQPIFRLNNADSAHFITKYSPTLLAGILKQMEADELSVVARLQLLHEQTLLARSGEIPTASLIPLLSSYKNETDESVWGIIALTISELKKFVETNETSERQLRNLSANIARSQYERLGWSVIPGETEFDTKLRGTIISLMLYGEDARAIEKALELYKTSELELLEPELRSLIIACKVRYGNDDSVIPVLIELYKTSPSADLKSDITSGLTSTSSPELIRQFLALLKDDSTIRRQDVFRWFISLIRHRDGRAITWQWLQDNWQWIVTTFGGDKSYDYFPRYTADALLTRKQLEEYKVFFTPMLSQPALTRVITLGISGIEGRVELLERDTKGVQAELAKL
jgi:aminopeptidase N